MKIKHLVLAAVCTWVVVVGSPSLLKAQVGSPTPTSTIESATVEPQSAQCVPTSSVFVDADSPAAFEYHRLESVTVNKTQFVLFNTTSSVSGVAATNVALIKSEGGKCESLIPEGRYISFARFMPLADATKLSKAWFEDLKVRDPDGYRSYTEALKKGSLAGEQGGFDAPMDSAVGVGATMPPSAKCSLFPEESKALLELGIAHKCKVSS